MHGKAALAGSQLVEPLLGCYGVHFISVKIKSIDILTDWKIKVGLLPMTLIKAPLPFHIHIKSQNQYNRLVLIRHCIANSDMLILKPNIPHGIVITAFPFQLKH